MADIFDEVEEELRRDRAKVLWDKYGKIVIAVAVLIVLATSGNVYWRKYTESQRLENAQQFLAAQGLAEAGRQDEAINAFLALAADAGEGYALIARFRAAALKAQAGDVQGALADYAALAADSDLEPLYREFAVLMVVINEGEAGDPAALLEELEPLTAAGKPWRHTARELAAVQHLRLGDTEKARETLTELADDLDAPRGARARATEVLRALEQ